MPHNLQDMAIPLDQAGRMLPLLHAAISRLGYAPQEMIWDATLRMARVNDLSLDLIAYADLGQPALNYEKQTPAVLFRPLPHNYTVARLIRDFDFRPVGAFLLASDLMVDTEKALALLNDFTLHGYWTYTEDGKHVLIFPPVSKTIPRNSEVDSDMDDDEARIVSFPQTDTCPACRHPLQPGMKFCGNCGTVVLPRDKPETFPTVCFSCGKPIAPGKKFCSNCGASVSAPAPAAPITTVSSSSSVCTACGNPIKSGAKFCGRCGKRFS